jgi:enoyl-CoA hydratase
VTGDFGGLVLLDHDDMVSTVTLHRPDRLNAMDAEMHGHLEAALRAADAEESTNCIVLTGAGRAFCAGGNVANMGAQPPIPTVLHRDLRLHWLMLAIEKPLIAMVNGAAVGLGLSLALACDLVLVAEDAKVGDTHVPLGINAGDGMVVPLLLHIGPQKTKEFLLRGQLTTGADLARMGVVNHAVPAGELRERTYALAREIAAQPRYATRATKLTVNRYIRSVVDELIECAMAYEMVAMSLPEHAEAVQAMQARRAARTNDAS